jgi:DNA-binding NtrC family response regulator
MRVFRTHRNVGPSDFRPFQELRKELLQRFETEYVESALRAAGGNVSMAARLAQIDRKLFWRLLRRTGAKQG